MSKDLEEEDDLGGWFTDKTEFGTKKKGRSASSWWMDEVGGGWWNSFSSKSKDEDKKVSALRESLRAVQRAANVIQNATSGGEEKQIQAKWAEGKEVNRSDDPTIWLSPNIPLKEDSLRKDWTDAERTDVLVAEALAESAMKRTMDPTVEDRMRRAGRSKVMPKKLTARLWTTTERIAAEHEIADDYPGFKSYFAAHRSYYTSDTAREQLQQMIEAAGDDIPMSLAVRALQWELLHPGESLDMPKALLDQIEWAKKALEKTKTSVDRENASRSVVNRYKKVFTVDEDEGGGDGPSPPSMPSSGTPGSGKKSDPGDPGDPGDDPGKIEIGLADETRGEKVDNDTGLKDMPDGDDMIGKDENVWKGGTDEILASPNRSEYNKLVAKLHSNIRKLMEQLKLRNEEKRIQEHGLKRGRLDEGSIYKLGFASTGFEVTTLFEQEEIKEPPKIAIGLLVDESGSMGGEKIEMARKLAIVLANALKGIHGVQFSVMGHSGQGYVHGKECDGMALVHYFTPDNPKMESMGNISAFVQNLDGYAIAKVVTKMIGWYPDCPKKMVIHLSDGLPAAGGYGGASAVKHVGNVTKTAARNGVRVLGIGVGAEFTKIDMTAMYGPNSFAIVKDMAQSALTIGKLIRDSVLDDTL